MATFTVKVPAGELSRAIKQIKAWDGRTRLRVENALRKGTRLVRREAMQRVPKDTGRLRKSLKTRFSSSKLEGQVYSMEPHAHLVEFGARAVIIRPKRKKALRIVLNYRERSELYARIDARVDDMVASGLFEEVEGLLKSGLSPESTAMQAIGYKEAAQALSGAIGREEAIALIKQNSRRYAKRQVTWFSRSPDALFLSWDGTPDFEKALRLSTEFLLARGLS